MSRPASHLPVALCALSLFAACAEEKADAELIMRLNPARADGGAGGGDAGAGTGKQAGDAGKQGNASSGKFDFKSFDDALLSAIDKHNKSAAGQTAPIKGASAVVVHKDHGIVHKKGYLEFKEDRVYLIASASKILSVGVLMKLQDEGLLDIDKPISEYLGEGWGQHKTNVTVAQLVSNSSGLPGLGDLLGATSMPMSEAATRLAAHGCQYNSEGTLTDCGKAIYQDDNPANNLPPDKMFKYGGSQWQLAGAVAEVVSGKSWADLIKETYVEPCDVPSLGYTNEFGRSDVAPLAYPHFDANPSKLRSSSKNPSIEGGAYAAAPDYGKLLLMHLRGGKCGDQQVLSAEAVKTMQTGRVKAYGGVISAGGAMPSPFNDYGLGWWINDDLVADPGAYGAFPYIDSDGEYGAMILIEVSSAVGTQLGLMTKPTLDALFAAAKK